METSVTEMGEVLYGDYNSRLQPLRLMYFSLDNRCLVADHPETIEQEASSHFCPNCNALRTNDEDKRNQNRFSSSTRCHQCFECPCCGNILVPALTSLELSCSAKDASPSYCLRCLYCQWTSEEYGLVANSPSDLVEAIIAREQNDHQDHAVIKDLLEAAKLRQSKRISRGPERGRGIAQRHRMDMAPSDTTSSWKMVDLDEAVSKRKEAVVAAASSLAPTSGVIATTEPETSREAKSPAPSGHQEDTDGPDPSLWTLSSGLESVGMKEMLEFGSAAAAAAQGEKGRGWPRRVRLHTKLGKRCRKDIATGRSEILIKPTFDPLLGDSSATKKGRQWFKKDCCAVHFIPWINVALLPSRASMESLIESANVSSGTSSALAAAKAAGPGERKPYIVLRLVNPQLIPLRVHFEGNGSGMVKEDVENGTAVGVVVRAKSWGNEDDWVRLESKALGVRHHFPESVVKMIHADSAGAVEGLDEDGKSNATQKCLLHQQGDVAWVRLTLDAVSSSGESATASSTSIVPSGEDVVVSTRFLLVIREGEGGGDISGASEDDLQVPVVVRFPLSRCRQDPR